jgi:hypothetical protein
VESRAIVAVSSYCGMRGTTVVAEPPTAGPSLESTSPYGAIRHAARGGG